MSLCKAWTDIHEEQENIGALCDNLGAEKHYKTHFKSVPCSQQVNKMTSCTHNM